MEVVLGRVGLERDLRSVARLIRQLAPIAVQESDAPWVSAGERAADLDRAWLVVQVRLDPVEAPILGALEAEVRDRYVGMQRAEADQHVGGCRLAADRHA